MDITLTDSAIPSKQRKKERWITGVYFVLSGFMTASWSSRIPDVQHRLHLNDAAWGTVLFALPLGLITGLVFSSWLVTRFGTRTIMVVSCVFTALWLALMGLAQSRIGLMLPLFMFGFSRTTLSISANTKAVELQQAYQKPIVATFHGLWSLACFAAIGLGTVIIIADVGATTHLIAIAVFCAVTGLVFRKDSNGRLQPAPEKKPLLVKPDRFLLQLGLIAFCAMLCESTMFDWSVHYFEKVVKTDKRFITAGYTAFIIAMSLGRLAGDRLIAAYGPITMLISNGIFMAAGFAIAAAFPFLLPAVFGFLLIGLGDSIVVPITYTLSARTETMPPSYAIAAVTLVGYLGFLTGPLLIGNLAHVWGMPSALALVSGLCLCITLLAVKVKKHRPALVAIPVGKAS